MTTRSPGCTWVPRGRPPPPRPSARGRGCRPRSRNGPSTSYRCRSEPQIAVVVTRMIASVGCSIFGSGTSSTRTSLVPCHTTAFITSLLAWLTGRCLSRCQRYSPLPGSVLLRLHSRLRGLRQDPAAAAWALFFAEPAITWSLPPIRASKPSLATSAGSSLAVCSRSLVPCMPARSKNSVSVGPGHQRGDRHAGVPQLVPQRLGEGQQERLGRGVGRVIGPWRGRCDRGGEQHGPAAARDHLRQRALGQVHRAGDVQADQPQLVGQLVVPGEVAADADARVDSERLGGARWPGSPDTAAERRRTSPGPPAPGPPGSRSSAKELAAEPMRSSSAATTRS